MSENTLKLIADSEARWVDLRFTDPRGKEQHVTFPAHAVDSEFFAENHFPLSLVYHLRCFVRGNLKYHWKVSLNPSLNFIFGFQLNLRENFS